MNKKNYIISEYKIYDKAKNHFNICDCFIEKKRVNAENIKVLFETCDTMQLYASVLGKKDAKLGKVIVGGDFIKLNSLKMHYEYSFGYTEYILMGFNVQLNFKNNMPCIIGFNDLVEALTCDEEELDLIK